jgi:hypothetical protein
VGVQKTQHWLQGCMHASYASYTAHAGSSNVQFDNLLLFARRQAGSAHQMAAGLAAGRAVCKHTAG